MLEHPEKLDRAQTAPGGIPLVTCRCIPPGTVWVSPNWLCPSETCGFFDEIMQELLKEL